LKICVTDMVDHTGNRMHERRRTGTMNRPVLGSRNRCSADAGVGAGAEYTRRFVAQARAAGWECGAAQPMGEGAGELHAGGGKLDWNDLAQRDRLGADRLELYRWGGDVLIAATAADQAHLIWSREGWASFPSDFETRTWCARLPTASSARSTISAGKQPTRAATICVDFPSDRPRHQGHVLRQQPVGGCRVQEAADQLGAGRHLGRQHAAARSHHAGASWPAFHGRGDPVHRLLGRARRHISYDPERLDTSWIEPLVTGFGAKGWSRSPSGLGRCSPSRSAMQPPFRGAIVIEQNDPVNASPATFAAHSAQCCWSNGSSPIARLQRSWVGRRSA
jgi:hypothetical protein